MKRIYLITVKEYNEYSGDYETIVSHGVNEDLETVAFPNVPVRSLDEAKFDSDFGWWVPET